MAIPGLSGARKVMEIKTGSGGDFLVIGMEGNEELGRLSEYRVKLVGELNMLDKPKDVDFDALLGTTATVTMKIDDDHPRNFNGYITRMQQGDQMGRFHTFIAHFNSPHTADTYSPMNPLIPFASSVIQ